MYHTAPVQVAETSRGLSEQPQPNGSPRFSPADEIGDRSPGDELHHDQVGLVSFDEVIHPHDVRVVQLGQGLRFTDR